MPWDENAFQARIMVRAKELGMTEGDVLRKAGLSANTFTKPPLSQGRTYNIIEAISGAVGMSVGEAIGAHSALCMPLLKTAIQTAMRAIGTDRPELLEEAIAWSYEVFIAHHRDRTPIDSSVISTVEKMVRSGKRR